MGAATIRRMQALLSPMDRASAITWAVNSPPMGLAPAYSRISFPWPPTRPLTLRRSPVYSSDASRMACHASAIFPRDSIRDTPRFFMSVSSTISQNALPSCRAADKISFIESRFI